MSESSPIQLHSSWKHRLEGEWAQPYMQTLKAFLQSEKAAHKIIYPKESAFFQALNSTPFDEVKVVILGQDPYHGPGQAHGLCFSVQKNQALPPSLKNIYKELETDLGISPASHGCLEAWAEQGVLLLNSVLSVEKNKPASHQGKGWELFTDRIVSLLNDQQERLVFMLWGAYAKKKGALLDRHRHLILEAAHPSPFSVRGFLGCRHFSGANAYLLAQGKQPIQWALSETK